MIKITVVNGETGLRLTVEGKLAEPWVSELELAWNEARHTGRNRQTVVDLSQMTSIDPKGEAALTAMIAEGARLTAKGLYCEYIAKQLMNRARRVRARRHRHDGAGASDLTSAKDSSRRAGRPRSQDSGGPVLASKEKD